MAGGSRITASSRPCSAPTSTFMAPPPRPATPGSCSKTCVPRSNDRSFTRPHHPTEDHHEERRARRSRKEVTMNHSLELGYLQIEVADPAALAPFLTDIIGLAPGEVTADGELTWSDDDALQRIIVSEGPRNDLAAVGFEA